ncbi:helix-turn-helix domain-containing protein [Bremerella sp.]|uniref:helix-turn-helix domain-containing protein n=1 Tax=Bremerella sp. TaxID=2795602 RepID=UPI003919BA16
MTLRIDETKDQVELPAAAVKCLVELLSTLSRGDAVTIESTSAELSIQQAAQFLDASRQFLEQLVEQGDIPCQRRGSRHVLLIRDLIRYKRDVDEKRSGALDELAEQAQNLDLGY